MANTGEHAINGAKSMSQGGGISGAGDRVRSDINSTAQEWSSAVKDAGANVARKVEDLTSSARQRGLDGAEQLEGSIRDYPWVAVGVAFGLGALFASTIRR